MKKTLSVTLAFVFLIVMLTSCGAPSIPGNVLDPAASKAPGASDAPAEPDEPDAPAASSTVDTSGLGPIGASFARYTDMKGKAYERVSAKIEEKPELGMYAMTLLPITMMDLALIPLTIVDMDETAAAMTLGFLGAENVKVSKDGNKRTVTYTDSEGKSVKFAADYDQATDSVQAAITDDTGKEALFFEYVKVGGGYASQYYSAESEGSTEVITAFFDESNITAFGFKKSAGKPGSIFKNTGITADLVKGGDTYVVMQDGKTTVHENGQDKTY